MKNIGAAIVVASGMGCICVGALLRHIAFREPIHPVRIDTDLTTGMWVMVMGAIVSVVGLAGWFKTLTVRDSDHR